MLTFVCLQLINLMYKLLLLLLCNAGHPQAVHLFKKLLLLLVRLVSGRAISHLIIHSRRDFWQGLREECWNLTEAHRNADTP